MVVQCTAHGHPLPSVTLSRQESGSWEYVEIQDGGIYNIEMTSDEEAREVSVLLTVNEGVEDYSTFQCTAKMNCQRYQTGCIFIRSNSALQ